MRWLRGLIVLAILLRFFGLEAMLLVLVLVILWPALVATGQAEPPAERVKKPAPVTPGPKLTYIKGGKG